MTSLDHMCDLTDLPDLAIDKILQFLPAKSGVQVSLLTKQWQSIFSSIPALSFDEEVDYAHHDLDLYYDYLIQHNKFINFLNGYINYHEKYDRTAAPLDKLKLHMTMYACEDDPTIQRWLKFANERGVKELDLCPKMTDPKEYGDDESYLCIMDYDYYELPWETFVNAKSLTTLKLEGIVVGHIKGAENQSKEHLLPSLKNMFFTNIWFQAKALVSLLSECPCVEYMSLSECMFEDSRCHISSSSLKSLIWSNSYPNADNLKSIEISADNLERLGIHGSLLAVDATIKSQNLNALKFFGYPEAKLSLKEDEAVLILSEVTEEKCIHPSSTHFISLWSFVKGFDFCKDITLHIQDVKAFIFPQRFSSPLPKTSILQVSMKKPPEEGSRDYLNLVKSLRWLAPSARITIKNVDGRFRKKTRL